MSLFEEQAFLLLLFVQVERWVCSKRFYGFIATIRNKYGGRCARDIVMRLRVEILK